MVALMGRLQGDNAGVGEQCPVKDKALNKGRANQAVSKARPTAEPRLNRAGIQQTPNGGVRPGEIIPWEGAAPSLPSPPAS